MPLVTCPSIRQVMNSLLLDLLEGRIQDCPILQCYIGPLSQLGLIKELVDACMHYIEPEVLTLEGKALLPEL